METIDKMVFYIKVFILLIAFSFSLYIAFMKMEFASANLLVILPMFIPFFILLILYVFDLFWEWKSHNLYCDLISILALMTILIISFRTIFDKNIVLYPALIGLDFYNIQEGNIKTLLYLMILGNIAFIFYQKKKRTKMHS